MQGSKLFPGHQHVIGRCFAPRSPYIWGGDRLVDPREQSGMPRLCKYCAQLLGIRVYAAGQDVQQGPFEPLRIGMAKFQAGQLFEMIVGKPCVVDDGLKDQRLAPRNRRAMAAQNGARGKLRARGHIGGVT